MARPPSTPQSWARELLETLQQDYHDFNTSIVPLLPYPTPAEFCKQLSRGRPCVYKIDPANDKHRWPALCWSCEDIVSKVKEPVDVAITPNGNADSLVPHPESPGDLLFVEPATIHLTLRQLMTRLALTSAASERGSNASIAYYLQSQNSNLTSTPLSTLLEDLPQSFDFADDLLSLDARNIWIGDDRSVTSCHHDPYENLYLVLKGSKTFRLWAPVDEISMPTRLVPTGRYTYKDVNSMPTFDIQIDDDAKEIPWVDMDPLSYPTDGVSGNDKLSLPVKMYMVTVKEGQILYLPAGWYHHVTQTCGKWEDGSRAPCVAVNYWYDMDYEGERYVLRQMLGRMVEVARREDASVHHQPHEASSSQRP